MQVSTFNNYASYSNYNNRNNTNFTGLTKKLKNQVYIDGQKDIEELIAKNPDVYPAVGQLPKFMFDKIPPAHRDEAIHEILHTFDDVANKIRDYSTTTEFICFPHKRNHIPDTEKPLSDVLRKWNILDRWDDDIEINYIDAGGKGKVFKLENLRDPDAEDEFVIKVFHNVVNEDWHPFKSHGCYAECNSGLYWRTQEGHDTQRGKFFFGNLGSGYIVSKFIDEDVRLPQRDVSEYKYGIKCTDEANHTNEEGVVVPVVNYNCLKGYYYDYGGMRVVNRFKNGNKAARKTLEKMERLTPDQRKMYWNQVFWDRKHYDDNKRAGLALGIKHLDNKNYYMDRCIELEETKVNQALGYVLKYLDHESALKYFDKLMQTTDETTQVILMNEIPLLSRRKDSSAIIEDDINYSLGRVRPEHIQEFFTIAKEHALPETVQHLASFVHLLPQENINEEYASLVDMNNPKLQERLMWKLHFVPVGNKDFAVRKLCESTDDKKRLLKLKEDIQHCSQETVDLLNKKLANID